MSTSTGDSDYGRFCGRVLWPELLLAGNVRDTHFRQKIFGVKCGFRLEPWMLVGKEVVNMTSL